MISTTRKKAIIYTIITIILILLAYFLFMIRNKLIKLLVPLLIAMVIAYLLAPIVKRLEKRHVKRTVSIILIYIIFIIAVDIAGFFIYPELVYNTKDLLKSLPNFTSSYDGMVKKLVNYINASRWAPETKNAILKEMNDAALYIQKFVITALKNSLFSAVHILTALGDLILSMLLAYYFIKDAVPLREGALQLFPRRWRNRAVATGREINSVLANFIQGQMVRAFIVGVLETIGLFIVGIKYPLILGLIGGLANIIPYFGPIIGAVPSVAVALLESPMKAFWTAKVFIIVQQIDNGFISPKIIEGKLGIHL